MSALHNGKPTDPEIVVIGYCVHCRSRRQMQGAIQVCNRRGRYDLKGHCDACGKSIYRLGGWDSVVTAHEAPRTASPAEVEPQRAPELPD
jgi:hypothetical protein